MRGGRSGIVQAVRVPGTRPGGGPSGLGRDLGAVAGGTHRAHVDPVPRLRYWLTTGAASGRPRCGPHTRRQAPLGRHTAPDPGHPTGGVERRGAGRSHRRQPSPPYQATARRPHPVCGRSGPGRPLARRRHPAAGRGGPAASSRTSSTRWVTPWRGRRAALVRPGPGPAKGIDRLHISHGVLTSHISGCKQKHSDMKRR